MKIFDHILCEETTEKSAPEEDADSGNDFPEPDPRSLADVLDGTNSDISDPHTGDVQFDKKIIGHSVSFVNIFPGNHAAVVVIN